MSKNLTIIRTLKRVVGYGSLLIIAIVSAVFLGWVLDVRVLTEVIPGFPSMKLSTAAGLLMCSIALYLTAHNTGRVNGKLHIILAGSAIMIGGEASLNLIFGWDIGFHQSAVTIDAAGIRSNQIVHMSPQAAANFLLIGLAIILLNRRINRRKKYSLASEYLAISALILTFAALLGHLYGAQLFNGTTAFNGLGLHTAFCFLILAIGCLAANRESRLINLFLSNSIGGVAVRRLLPIVVFLPTIIGLLRIVGQNMGLYDTGVGVMLTVMTSIVLMSGAIFYFSSMSHHSDLRRRAIENKLASNEKKFRELFDYGQSLISLHDLDGIMTKVNPALLSALGYSQDEVVGKSLRDFFPLEYHPQFADYLREIEDAGISQGYLTLISKNGDRRAWRYHNILVAEPGRRPYVLGHAQDVTMLLAAEKALRNLSLTDDLTKLYNRRGFLTHAKQQIKLEKHSGTARGLNLLFADMDGLKKINDTYGHEAGSDAIIALANVFGSVMRSADLVARWGGDEFVILTIGSTDESAVMMVDRIKGRLAEHNKQSDLPYDISCSIGIATFDPRSSRSIESIIAEADESMYKDKELRKMAPRECFFPTANRPEPQPVFE